jgi:hypothetical protein
MDHCPIDHQTSAAPLSAGVTRANLDIQIKTCCIVPQGKRDRAQAIAHTATVQVTALQSVEQGYEVHLVRGPYRLQAGLNQTRTDSEKHRKICRFKEGNRAEAETMPSTPPPHQLKAPLVVYAIHVAKWGITPVIVEVEHEAATQITTEEQ